MVKAKTGMKKRYENEIVPVLKSEYKLKSVMAVPRLEKVVINMGTRERLKDKANKERLMGDLAAISGQKPKVQTAKVSVSGFGIREGNPVGLTVTLRGEKMFSFLERFIGLVLPRVRDFRGVSSRSFDGGGNYTIGISEYVVFPEIEITKALPGQGMEITIVIENSNKEKSRRLLELMGLPFRKEDGE